ncbi:MAG: hypothetical protein ACPG4Z_03480 [Chitinophagales bacterium]
MNKWIYFLPIVLFSCVTENSNNDVIEAEEVKNEVAEIKEKMPCDLEIDFEQENIFYQFFHASDDIITAILPDEFYVYKYPCEPVLKENVVDTIYSLSELDNLNTEWYVNKETLLKWKSIEVDNDTVYMPNIYEDIFYQLTLADTTFLVKGELIDGEFYQRMVSFYDADQNFIDTIDFEGNNFHDVFSLDSVVLGNGLDLHLFYEGGECCGCTSSSTILLLGEKSKISTLGTVQNSIEGCYSDKIKWYLPTLHVDSSIRLEHYFYGREDSFDLTSSYYADHEYYHNYNNNEKRFANWVNDNIPSTYPIGEIYAEFYSTSKCDESCNDVFDCETIYTERYVTYYHLFGGETQEITTLYWLDFFEEF